MKARQPKPGRQVALKHRVGAIALGALLCAGITLSLAKAQQPDGSQQQKQPSSVPDAPTPQAGSALPGIAGPIAPGKGDNQPIPGANSSSETGQPPANSEQPPEPQQEPSQATPPATQEQPPAPPSAEDQNQPPPESGEAALTKLIVNVNYVEVPVTVKDNKGNAVTGLDWRDFRVYENNVYAPLHFFSTDPRPLSVAFVIDQTLPSNVMDRVNQSLGSIQGALTSFDEAAVFTYTNGPKEWTGFTGAQSQRLPAVLSLAQATGTDTLVPVAEGNPLGNACPIYQNGQCADPNIQPGRSAGQNGVLGTPKEIHTLNDAILAAAKELSTRPKERRRVIYVISDGKEYGSKASWKEVVHYLQTNKIAVYGTLVGDSARWGEGWLDRYHLPFEMYGNILYEYTANTGGNLDAQNGVNGIEKSYAAIAAQVRNQYTLGYLSHESIYDGKYRNITVLVKRPNLVVTAKPGYYPSAQDYR
jgi:VWFA-related protein